jgi:hypothetical protein
LTYRLYHVGFQWVVTPPKMTELEPIFSGLGDWLRFNVNDWFAWSEKGSPAIYEALRVELRPEDGLLIIPVDPSEYFGWAKPFVWEWLNAKRMAVQGQAPANPDSYFGRGLESFGKETMPSGGLLPFGPPPGKR